MPKRFETARSLGEQPLMLIFVEGSWEALPFEIRLMCPWYESEIRSRNSLTAAERFELATRGYSIATALSHDIV